MVSRKGPVAKSKKKIKRLRRALKSARRDEYGPAMITKAGRPRCPNPACREAAKYGPHQMFCTRCGGGMLAGLHKSVELGLLTKITAEHDPAARERLYRATFPLYGPGNGGAA